MSGAGRTASLCGVAQEVRRVRRCLPCGERSDWAPADRGGAGANGRAAWRFVGNQNENRQNNFHVILSSYHFDGRRYRLPSVFDAARRSTLGYHGPPGLSTGFSAFKHSMFDIGYHIGFALSFSSFADAGVARRAPRRDPRPEDARTHRRGPVRDPAPGTAVGRLCTVSPRVSGRTRVT